jgi:hypothetical protein
MPMLRTESSDETLSAGAVLDAARTRGFTPLE